MVELLVVVAVVSILALLAAPSFNDFIRLQRLKSVTAQVVTDMQLARTEATARNQWVWVRFGASDGSTCYSMYVGAVDDCDCTAAPVCANGATEIRTVAVPRNRGVRVVIPEVGRDTPFEFDPSTGGIRIPLVDDGRPAPDQFVVDTQIDATRLFRVEIKPSGRPGICKPAGSTMDASPC